MDGKNKMRMFSHMVAREYQHRSVMRLKRIFPPHLVANEWLSRAEGEDAMYFPRVDIAVGPFAIDGTYEEEYDSMFEQYRAFVEDAKSYSIENGDSPYRFQLNSANRNARCFLAIEIEHRTDSKHVLGSILNAVALGRIGILVALEGQKTIRGEPFDKLAQCMRLKRYIQQLTELKKNTLNLDNLLILDHFQFEQVVNQHVPPIT